MAIAQNTGCSRKRYHIFRKDGKLLLSLFQEKQAEGYFYVVALKEDSAI